jgi:hypothetical protein
MDRLTDSQNRFTEEGEQFEQAPGGLTKITTDTEDMPSTHTKLLSSPIYAVFVESSQMQSRKKADDIVGTSSSSSPKRNLERRGRARKIEKGRQRSTRWEADRNTSGGGPPGAKWGKERRGDKNRIEDERKRCTCKTFSWSAQLIWSD